MEVWNKYANTAARKHGKPGRDVRPKSLTVDMHCHVTVPRVADIVGPHLKNTNDPLVAHSTPETQALMAKQAADVRTRMSTTDERFAAMDEMGVDIQLTCPAPPQIYYYLPLEVGVAAARTLNDGIAEYVGKHKDRLIALGGVPMQDGNEAAKELERCMKLGFKGVEILTNVNGKELSDPAFAPFWKKAEELDALVFIHPTGFTQPQRFARFYFNNVIGNPLDTTVALHYLIFDGVFERHPKLRVLAAHGGGFLGAYSGRIDHAWGARSDAHGNLPQPPTTYLRRNVYLDTVVFTPHQLEALVRTYGADRIVMGTDYPFDMLEYDPIGHVASVESFDDKTRAALCGGNAKTILGI
jgi:aminocarboxymuconate-semialdehyde decarboxylase